MKMGTTCSPWRYDAAARVALQFASPRCFAIHHYAFLDLSCADLVVRLLLRSSHRGWSPGQTTRARSCREQSQRDPHYSITSSARASTPGGIARPSAFAVLRLITSSNLVGCKTGKSAGLAPCRILPV